jgi:hypothetical protein
MIALPCIGIHCQWLPLTVTNIDGLGSLTMLIPIPLFETATTNLRHHL